MHASFSWRSLYIFLILEAFWITAVKALDSLTTAHWAIVSVLLLAGLFAWDNRARIRVGLSRVEPTHLILIGVVGVWVIATVALAGVIWQQVRTSRQSQAAVAVPVEAKATASEFPKPEPVTNPYDIPKKLALIDDRILPILRIDFEGHIIRGRYLQENWSTPSTHEERQAFLKSLKEYNEQTGELFRKLRRIQLGNEHYSDVFAVLDHPIAGDFHRAMNESVEAFERIGDPPYHFDLKFFVRPYVESLRTQLNALAAWVHETERKAIALRQEIASEG